MIITLQILAGFVLLVFGGDTLVRGAVNVAKRLGVSPLLIGLTLVGFGTSTPELVTSLKAALDGAPDIAVGNVVGSNICNILLILGITAAIYPVACDPRALRRDGTVVMATAVLGAAVFVLFGEVGRITGAAFLGALAFYIIQTYRAESATPQDPSAQMHAHEMDIVEGDTSSTRPLWFHAAVAVFGIVLTILGAKFLVEGSVALARNFGVSEAVIGLTLVAVGTSLPELVTAAAAAWRKQSDIVLGNILGSNIFNILFILGTTALVKPIPVATSIVRVDIWIMLAVSALFLVFARTGHRIARAEGIVFLALYAAYMLYLAKTGMA